jgi:splicing factor, arginine/serine-rich 4/5/6
MMRVKSLNEVLMKFRPYFSSRVVEFATLKDMKTAIEKLDDTELNGRRIRLVEDTRRNGRRGRSRSSSSRSRSRSRRRSR